MRPSWLLDMDSGASAMAYLKDGTMPSYARPNVSEPSIGDEEIMAVAKPEHCCEVNGEMQETLQIVLVYMRQAISSVQIAPFSDLFQACY